MITGDRTSSMGQQRLIGRWGMSQKSGESWRIFLIWFAANIVGFALPPLIPLLFPSLAA